MNNQGDGEIYAITVAGMGTFFALGIMQKRSSIGGAMLVGSVLIFIFLDKGCNS